MRFHDVSDCSPNGKRALVPFTPEEEAIRDTQEAAWAEEQKLPRPVPRDLAAEIDALRQEVDQLKQTR